MAGPRVAAERRGATTTRQPSAAAVWAESSHQPAVPERRARPEDAGARRGRRGVPVEGREPVLERPAVVIASPSPP